MMVLGPAGPILVAKSVVHHLVDGYLGRYIHWSMSSWALVPGVRKISRLCFFLGAIVLVLLCCVIVVLGFVFGALAIPLGFALMVPMQKLKLHHIDRAIAMCARGVPFTYAAFPMFAIFAAMGLHALTCGFKNVDPKEKLSEWLGLKAFVLWLLGLEPTAKGEQGLDQVIDAFTDVGALVGMVGRYPVWLVIIYIATVASSVANCGACLTNKIDYMTSLKWGLFGEDVWQVMFLLVLFHYSDATEFMFYSFISALLAVLKKTRTLLTLAEGTSEHHLMTNMTEA